MALKLDVTLANGEQHEATIFTGTWDEFKDVDCLEVESRDEELEDDAAGK